jgi:hypothetical protein
LDFETSEVPVPERLLRDILSSVQTTTEDLKTRLVFHPIRQMCRSCFVELGGAIAAINMFCRLLEEGHTGTGDRTSADVAIGEKRTGADQIRRRCSLKPPCA